MARHLRIQYPGAIDHIMARGNGREDIVEDDADRKRLRTSLERAVTRSGWVLYDFVLIGASSTSSSSNCVCRPHLGNSPWNRLGAHSTSSPGMTPVSTARRKSSGLVFHVV